MTNEKRDVCRDARTLRHGLLAAVGGLIIAVTAFVLMDGTSPREGRPSDRPPSQGRADTVLRDDPRKTRADGDATRPGPTDYPAGRTTTSSR